MITLEEWENWDKAVSMITLDEWENWDKRHKALQELEHKVIVMLCIEWTYSILPIFEKEYPLNKNPRKAIEAAENYVSNNIAINIDNLDFPMVRNRVVWAAIYTFRSINVDYAADSAAYAAAEVAWASGSWEYTYKTYLHTLGPNNKEFKSSWITSTVLDVAKSEDYLILADALEDAGCNNIEVLEHLRQNTDFTRTDWVLRQIKGLR